MVSKVFFNPSEDHYEFVKEKHKEKMKKGIGSSELPILSIDS